VTAPTRATTAGRAYLDLRKKARQDCRPVDEPMQLYVLEAFLARMAATGSADQFVLKGGVLLAVFGQRRPTRDIDLQAQSIVNDPPRSAPPSLTSPQQAWTAESSSTPRPRRQRPYARTTSTRPSASA
jgi:hypothetical protein